MEQHGAGHGVQVQHGPDALSARLCVLDDVIGEDIAGVGTKVALKYFEGCTFAPVEKHLLSQRSLNKLVFGVR